MFLVNFVVLIATFKFDNIKANLAILIVCCLFILIVILIRLSDSEAQTLCVGL